MVDDPRILDTHRPPRLQVPLISDEKGDPRNDPTRPDFFNDARAPEDDEDDDPEEAERKRALLAQALSDFRTMETFERGQRERELEDLKFDRAFQEDQWPDHILKARSAGTAANGVYTPDRPCLTIPKLDQPVQQILDEARRARLGVIVKPKGNGADKEGAWVRQGLYRNMEMRCNANQVRGWGLDRAVKCGRGWYAVDKQYVTQPSPDQATFTARDFDQEVILRRILNQHSIYMDPFIQRADGLDAERAHETSDITLSQFKRNWPKAKISSMTSDDLQSLGNEHKGWITNPGEAGGERTVRVSRYWHVTHAVGTLFNVPGLGFVTKDKLPAELEPAAVRKLPSRPLDKRTVHLVHMTANEILAEQEWDGQYIPIVPVIGKEYNVNGDRCWKGVISNSKDSQRMYNYTSSGAAEASGLLSRAPWVMAEGQDEGYKAMWNEPNNYRYLVYKPTTFEDQLVPPPSRNFGTVDLSAFVELRQQADQDIQATTARYGPSLGRYDQHRSGIAVQELKASGESSTSVYLDNLAQVSMMAEAKIVLDLFGKIYDAEGRIERVLSDEEVDEQAVMLNRPFYYDEQKQPQPADTQAQAPGMLAKVRQAIPMLRGAQSPKEQIKHYDMTKGDYDVVIDVGKSFANQQDQDLALIGSLIEAAPSIVPRVADILAEQMNGPIAKRLADRLRPPDVQDAEKGGQPSPEQIAEMMKQHQALIEQNQQLKEALESKQAEAAEKNKASVIVAEIRAATDKEIARIRAAADTASSLAKFKTDFVKHIAELEADKAGLEADRRAEFINQRLGELHQLRMAAAQPPVAPGGPEATA